MGTAQALSCIIDAATQIQDSLPHVRFLFIGGGVDVPMLQSRSKGLRNVEFRPPVPQSEIGGVLSDADCLLVHLKADPVFKITIPSKIQAYLYAGKPILCGVEGDAADLVIKAKAGLKFEPENIQSCCEAIERLAGMKPNELREMGQSGRSFYNERLCFKRGVDQIETSLVRALGK
jgi:glycosyltransferase involved in cell wall biosynthesis